MNELVESLWNRFPEVGLGLAAAVHRSTHLSARRNSGPYGSHVHGEFGSEVRVPFMDYRLVRLSQKLAGAQKQTPKEFKVFLKQALGHRCPPELLTRPKWGFDTPLGRWVGQPNVLAAMKRLPEGVAVKEGLLSGDAIRSMVENAQTARKFARQLWSLLVLESWLRVRNRMEAPRETLSELLSSAY